MNREQIIEENKKIEKLRLDKGNELYETIIDGMFTELPFIDGIKFKVGNLGEYRENIINSCNYWHLDELTECGCFLYEDDQLCFDDFDTDDIDFSIYEKYNQNIKLIEEYKQMETISKKEIKKYKEIIEIIDDVEECSLYNFLKRLNIDLLDNQNIDMICNHNKSDTYSYLLTEIYYNKIINPISNWMKLIDNSILLNKFYPDYKKVHNYEYTEDYLQFRIVELFRDKTYNIIIPTNEDLKLKI